MSDRAELRELPLAQRVVLLGLADLERGDRTPAHSGDVVRTCTAYLDDADVEALGRLGEAEVSRALNRLEAEDLVEMERSEDASPVGKGRPRYEPSPSGPVILEALGADQTLQPLVATLQTS